MILRFAIALVLYFGACSCSNTKKYLAFVPAAPEFINAEAAAPLGPYSSVVRAGDLVFTAGIIGFDAKTGAFAKPNIEAQTEQVFDNLEAALASAGAHLEDLVKVTIFLKSPADVQGMNAVYQKRIGDSRPARTTVPGADWGRDDILIEIEAIAVCRCE